MLLLAAAFAYGQSGGPAAACTPGGIDADLQKGLSAEIRKLRIELLEVRIEAQAAKLPALEQALTRIEEQRNRLAEDERNTPQRLAAMDARFANQTLPPEQRVELDGVKATFLAAQAERSNTERSALQAREAETSASLKLEQQRLQALQSKLAELTAAR
jgi:hypothetical protein